jgi:hypothetical protein
MEELSLESVNDKGESALVSERSTQPEVEAEAVGNQKTILVISN